jgi:D-arabinose 1-dehydrogenase-like Zn-dependent alcohol dehydrogenase
MSAVLGGLSVNGKLIVIGASDEMIEVPPLLLISGRRSITGWPSGTSIDSQDTLSFSVHSINFMIMILSFFYIFPIFI